MKPTSQWSVLASPLRSHCPPPDSVVVGPNADGALGEVSIEAVATANSPNAPPEVERSADPPTLKIAPKSPVTKGGDDNDIEPDLDALVASFEASKPDPPQATPVSAEHQGERLVLLLLFLWLWFFVGFVLVVFWLLVLFCGLVCLVVFRNLPLIRNCLRLVSVSHSLS